MSLSRRLRVLSDEDTIFTSLTPMLLVVGDTLMLHFAVGGQEESKQYKISKIETTMSLVEVSKFLKALKALLEWTIRTDVTFCRREGL